MPQPRQYPDHAARQRAYRARQAQAHCAAQQAKGLPAAASLPTLPSRARWQALLTQAQQCLETARDELQTYCDERSDAWQQGERAALLHEQRESVEQVLAELEAVPSW
jgi:hypothetical protein